jgi:hypothetical protein
MITGFNTDVEYDGRVYHVQTEDKGRGNPVVESLVYVGGEILTSRRIPYRELVDDPDFGEPELLDRMESQHKQMIRDIRNGRFDPDGPKPFGYNIVSNRSLDEVVLSYLGDESEEGPERIRLEPEDAPVLVSGQPARMKFRVLVDGEDRPVAGALLRVKLISTQDRPRTLFRGSSDLDGRLTAEFDIPQVEDDADAAVVVQVEAAGRNAEMKQFVRRKPPAG